MSPVVFILLSVIFVPYPTTTHYLPVPTTLPTSFCCRHVSDTIFTPLRLTTFGSFFPSPVPVPFVHRSIYEVPTSSIVPSPSDSS
ncbi:hypothetical protein GGR50DRAFT_645346 [Xylaria sp. CBS 124048]|nr:hypothetical protein GGR50DRAFT_645346 [Xylaria sp. CBS 124048]